MIDHGKVRPCLRVAWCLALATAYVSAQQSPVGAAPSPSGYILGADDQILIRGFDGSDIVDKPVLIGANGNVTLPLIGRVKAAGFTVEQLETQLGALLKTYIKEPQISVTVTEFRSQPVSVFGAVNNPGVIQLRGRKTLYEVLSMAGGPREATGSTISITRQRENGKIPLPGAVLDPGGEFSSAQLDIQEILAGKNPAADIEIKPHDVISVAQTNARMVYVVGDVTRNGAFALGPQKTVSVLSALSLAGGLGRTAKPKKAKIFREIQGQQKPQEIAVDIDKILAGKAEDLGLHADDILVVPTSSRKTFTTYMLPVAIAAAVSAAVYALH